MDFKVAVPQKVRDITEEVCSFANAAGGYVLIGIDDHGTVKGTTIDNSKRSAIQNSIGEISPALHCDLYPVDVDGTEVWVVEVPAGRQVPYFFGGSCSSKQRRFTMTPSPTRSTTSITLWMETY